MRVIYIIIFNLIFLNQLKAQEHTYNNLSRDFNFEIKISRIPARFSEPHSLDSCFVDFKIINKKIKNKIIYERFHNEVAVDKKSFCDSSNVKSYSTEININKPIINNDYGDIIVLDINFDGLEDVAIKRYERFGALPKYFYYIQSKDERFYLDKFLTYEMSFFPTTINKLSKTLEVKVCEILMKYELREDLKKWIIVTE
jgi:hypothetical protein